MEYVPGGELFTHLREEGSFDPAKAGYRINLIQFLRCPDYSSFRTYAPERHHLQGSQARKYFDRQRRIY